MTVSTDSYYDLSTPEGRENFIDKIEWEGGIWETIVNYGLQPTGDDEIVSLAAEMVSLGKRFIRRLRELGMTDYF